MSASLVGSEMCIRDRHQNPADRAGPLNWLGSCSPPCSVGCDAQGTTRNCLLYTSDAADDM
eukprot:662233-Alexandrium_andersonii.AAC.1